MSIQDCPRCNALMFHGRDGGCVVCNSKDHKARMDAARREGAKEERERIREIISKLAADCRCGNIAAIVILETINDPDPR